MPHCAAIGCKNKSSSKSKAQLEFEKYSKITFHCFPKNPDKQKVWIDCMGLTKEGLPKYPYLCSCHFSNESFDRTSACKIRLRDEAVPSASKVNDKPNIATSQDIVILQEIIKTNIDNETIKLEHSRADEVLTVNGVEEQRRIKLKIINFSTDYGTKEASTETQQEQQQQQPQSVDEAPKDCGTKYVSTETQQQQQQQRRPQSFYKAPKTYGAKHASTETQQRQQRPQSVDKGTWVCSSFLGDSPTNIHLRNEIKNQKVAYERKIKLLKQTIRRKDQRIALLKILPEFRKIKK